MAVTGEGGDDSLTPLLSQTKFICCHCEEMQYLRSGAETPALLPIWCRKCLEAPCSLCIYMSTVVKQVPSSSVIRLPSPPEVWHVYFRVCCDCGTPARIHPRQLQPIEKTLRIGNHRKYSVIIQRGSVTEPEFYLNFQRDVVCSKCAHKSCMTCACFEGMVGPNRFLTPILRLIPEKDDVPKTSLLKRLTLIASKRLSRTRSLGAEKCLTKTTPDPIVKPTEIEKMERVKSAPPPIPPRRIPKRASTVVSVRHTARDSGSQKPQLLRLRRTSSLSVHCRGRGPEDNPQWELSLTSMERAEREKSWQAIEIARGELNLKLPERPAVRAAPPIPPRLDRNRSEHWREKLFFSGENIADKRMWI
ncbi:hypothetical protein EJ06DRAFT_578676 [Trichodelitschia bisporula]|uniref:Uncharacterized protein n=1 Tax=Trichodelitschia bisporula TaxID=703511 RepID=A0A6G1IB43_9PEZI|nr:hypothetical protein EJ06DRAFT_578676 [Trichodelitschia bisporula]